MPNDINDLIKGFELGILDDQEIAEYNQLKGDLQKGSDLGVLDEQEMASFNRISGSNGSPVEQERPSARDLIRKENVKAKRFFFPEAPDTNVLESIAQDKESSLGATIGGIGGGVVGIIAGRGSPAGSAFGSGVGAFVGDQIDQGIRRYLGLPTQDTFLESIGKSGKEGAFFTAADLIGQGISKGIDKGVSKIKAKITPAKMEAAKFLEGKVGKKAPLTLGQLTESRPIDMLENITESSLIGGGTITTLKLSQKEGLNKFAEQFGNSIVREVKNPDQLGDLVMAVVRGRVKPVQDASKILFNTVFDRTRNIKRIIIKKEIVDGKILDASGKSVTREIIKKQKVDILDMRPIKEWALNKLGRDVKNLKGINQVTGKSIINKITQQKDFISLPEANQLRTALRKLGESQPLVPKSASANRIGASANSRLLAEMRKTLQQFAPNELQGFDLARKMSFQGSRPFANKFVRTLLNAGDEKFGNAPATIVKKIFARNNGRNIEKLKTFIDDKTFTDLKGFLWRDILERSTNKDTGEIIGTKLHNSFFSESGLGASTLNATFTKKEIVTIKRLTNALKEVERKEGEGIGRMAIQFAQAGAVLQLSTGVGGRAGDKSAIAILVGPALIARAFTNPKIIDLIIRGQLTKNKKMLITILTKIVAELSSVDDFIISEFKDKPKKVSAPLERVPMVR